MSDLHNRVIDFRFAPEINQTCIGLVDDYYKTIVREDGSLKLSVGKGTKISL